MENKFREDHADSDQSQKRPLSHEPRQQRGKERRQAVIEGAARVFDRVGFGEASLAAIVEESGASPGSLYFYFKTKNEIALVIVREQNRRTADALNESRPGESSLHTLIRASFDIAELLVTDPVVSAGIRLSLEQGTLSEPTADYYREWIAGVAETFQKAQEEGDVASDLNASELARTVVPYFTGVHLVSNVLDQRTGLLEVLRVMWLVLIAAIVPDERRRKFSDIVTSLAEEG